jgi:uroporphyrinogen III methyltransferase/synthase
LRGLRILAARPAGQFAKTAAAIEEHGGEAISFPCIQTAKLDLPPETFAHITGYDWLVFVSPSGVRYFFEGLFAAGGDARTVGPRKVAAIGPATAKALEAYGIRADLVPQKSDSGGLGRALVKAAAGARVLIPRSAKGSSELHDILRAKGIDAAEIGIYDTIPAEVSPYVLALAESGSFDAVFFACPSSVRAFVSLLPNTEPKGVLAVCIGAATGRVAKGCGMKTILAEETSAAGMVRALAEYRRGEETRERRLL